MVVAVFAAFGTIQRSLYTCHIKFNCLRMQIRRVSSTIISLSRRAVIRQFSGSYSPVRPAKFKAGFVAKLFCDLLPSVLNFYSK